MNYTGMTLLPAVVVTILIVSLTVAVIIFSFNNIYGQLYLTTEKAGITKQGPTSPSSNNPQASSSPSSNSCINYDSSTRTITVSCSAPARLTDIDNKLHDNSILAKQPNGVWFFSANLVIAKGATFHIDSTDTKWLKISSKVTHVSGIAKIAHAYIIDVHGSLKIDSVKITSLFLV